MIQDTQNRKNALLRPILCVLIGILGVYILVAPLPAKAENNFIDNISFFCGSDDFLHLSFHVKTTFSTVYNFVEWNGCVVGASNFGNNYVELWELGNSITFTAGNNYNYAVKSTGICAGQRTSCNGINASHYILFNRSTAFDPSWTDTEKVYFTEYPTLTMDYPFDEAEISTAFNITGSYTLPEGSSLNKLMAYFGYDVSGEANFYEFYQDVSPPSGNVNIRVSGLPIRSYLLGFSFINTSDEDDYYMVLKWYDIHIVKDIPPELPSGEIPPLVFEILDPASYYTANSSYASSTLLFDNLSGALKPIILTIGNNLTFFSSKFEQSKAQETGETMAGGVLVVRTYANNLNTFFSDLPIAQALFLYLLLLVVVAVFRIIKNLINLIKP